jgi:hypothetical protein
MNRESRLEPRTRACRRALAGVAVVLAISTGGFSTSETLTMTTFTNPVVPNCAASIMVAPGSHRLTYSPPAGAVVTAKITGYFR